MNIAQIKKNKKGFTIVELVIVIAVIAILAAVLIPTFATVIDKSHQSNALSRAKSAYTEIIASKDKGSPTEFANSVSAIEVSESGNYYKFTVEASSISTTPTKSGTATDAATNAVEGYTVPSTMSDVKIIAK